jgi:hypothetical protein
MPLSQIGPLHVRVLADFVNAAGRDDASIDQHRNAVRKREHSVHVVLDQQDRRFAAQRVEKAYQFPRSFRTHARHRLVEEKGLGLHRERHGDFQSPPLAMRKLGRRDAGARAQADSLQRGAGRPCQEASLMTGAKKRKFEPCRACTASITLRRAENSGIRDEI